MQSLSEKVKYPPAGKYIVAVSGGVDSMVLLTLLSRRPDLQLQIAHVNHGLRVDSHMDERLVKETADALHIPLRITHLNLKKKNEEEARRERYRFLYKVADEAGAKGIITAHHADDSFETSLFNAWRGAETAGLLGIRSWNNLYRPLLDVSKKQIQEYADSHAIPWREDLTNQDTEIGRNLLRHHVIPLVEESHPELIQKYRNMQKKLEFLHSQTEAQIETWLKESAEDLPDGISFDRNVYKKLPPAAARSVLVHCLRRVEPGLQLNQDLVLALVKMAKSRLSTSQKPVSAKLKLIVRYDRVFITRAQTLHSVAEKKPLILGRHVEYGSWRLLLSPSPTGAMNENAIPAGHYSVRGVEPGDRISLTGGSKKLQDLFVDKKVPREQRSVWPVVVNDQQEIICIPGVATSKLATMDVHKGIIHYLKAEVV